MYVDRRDMRSVALEMTFSCSLVYKKLACLISVNLRCNLLSLFDKEMHI